MTPILRLLGRFEIATSDGRPLAVSGARAQLLLARLAMARGERLDRAVLSAMFWADRAEAQARASLRQTIWALRQELKDLPDALIASGEGLRLDLSVISCDVANFERLAGSKAPSDLEAAVALYRGEYLEGFDLVGLSPDSDFLPERHRMRDLGLRVAGDLAALNARAGSWEDVVRVARRGLAIDGYHEALHARLIEALHRLGRQREARDQDEAFRNLMKSELGITLARQTAPGVGSHASTPTLPATGPEGHALSPSIGEVPPRKLRMLGLVGGIAIVSALFALSGAMWWQWAGQPVAPPDAPAKTTASERIPSANLQAYDLFLRAESERRAASNDAHLRAAMVIYG